MESRLRPVCTSIMGIRSTTSATDIEAGSKHPVQMDGLAGEGAAPVHKVRVCAWIESV